MILIENQRFPRITKLRTSKISDQLKFAKENVHKVKPNGLQRLVGIKYLTLTVPSPTKPYKGKWRKCVKTDYVIERVSYGHKIAAWAVTPK